MQPADRPFFPRCMGCQRGLAMRKVSVRPSVRPSIRPSVRLSNACMVTQRKKDLSSLHSWPKLTHPAARSLCDSWATCCYTWRYPLLNMYVYYCVCLVNCASVYFMPKFFKDFTIPYYAVKCEEKMLDRQLEEMKKFFCQGVPDCVFDIALKSCEPNANADPTVRAHSGWLRSTVVERRSFAGDLSLFCAWPAADGWPLMWVNRPLQVNQLGQLSLSFFRGQ